MKECTKSSIKRALAYLMSLVIFASVVFNGNIGAGQADGEVEVEVVLGSFTNPTETSLGSVGNYAVFAKEFDKANHMEGTIAVKMLNIISSAAFGVTGNVAGYINEDENIIYMEDITNFVGFSQMNDVTTSNVIVPAGTVIDRTFNNKQGIAMTYDGQTVQFNQVSNVGKTVCTVDQTDYQIDFDEAFRGLVAYSAHFFNDINNGPNSSFFSNERAEIVCHPGNNVISVPYTKLASTDKNGTMRNPDLYVTCQDDFGNESDQFSLIINVVDESGNALTDQNIYFDFNHIIVNGEQSAYGPEGGKVLWNFGPSFTGEAHFVQCILGHVLAPVGKVYIEQSHNGSVYASYVINQNCEIHQNKFNDYQDKDVDNKGTIILKKVVTVEPGSALPSEAELAGIDFVITTPDNRTYSYNLFDSFTNASLTKDDEGNIKRLSDTQILYIKQLDIPLAASTLGSTYIIEEKDYEVPGYDVETMYYTETAQIYPSGQTASQKTPSTKGTSASVTLYDRGITTVGFDNDYTEPIGTLAISKDIIGAETDELEDLTFTVTTIKEEKVSTLVTEIDDDGIEHPVRDEDGNRVYETTVTEVEYYLDENGALSKEPKEIGFENFDYDATSGKYVFGLNVAASLDGSEYFVLESNAEINGKPLTVTYKVDDVVTEAGEKGVSVNVVPEETSAVDITNDYSESFGNLSIVKTLSGDLTEEEKIGGLTFVVSAGDGKYLGRDDQGNAVISENEADGTYTIAAPAGSTSTNVFEKSLTADNEYVLRFANVPEGTVVSVTESNHTFADYTETITYFVNGDETQAPTVTVEADEDSEIIINDAYEIKKEDLVITKTISGDLNDAELYGGITFVVSAGEGKYLALDNEGNAYVSENEEDGTYVILAAPGSTANSFNYVEDGCYELVFANVPVGTTVTVTETDSFVEGYTEEVTYFVNGDAEASGSEASVTITKDDNFDSNTILFNNEYTEDKGSLKITKLFGQDSDLVLADLTTAQKENISFTITGPDNFNTTIKLSEFGENNYYVLTDLALGLYTVVESQTDDNTPNYTLETTYSVANGTIEVTKSLDPAEIVVTNTYTEDTPVIETEDLEITKMIAGDLTEEEKYGGLTFVISAGDGKYLGKDADGNAVISENKADGTYVIAAQAGTTGVNTFDKVDGTDHTYKLTFANVPVGTTVTVTETNATITGYTEEVTYTVSGREGAGTGTEMSLTVTKDDNFDINVITITDEYKEDVIETEDLEITKTISGQLTEEEKYGGITFVVSTSDGKYLGKDAEGNAVFSENEADGTYVIAAAPGSDANTFDKVDGEDGAYELTFANVPVGTTVTVTETDSYVEGYTETVTYFVNGGSENWGDEASITITKEDANVILFSDYYEEILEDLKITKTISGDLNDEEKYGGITFVVSAGEGKYLGKDAYGNAVISENVADGTYVIAAAPGSDANTFDKVDGEDGAYELTFAGVPAGTTVTVTETDSYVEGYTETVTYFVNGGAETTGSEASVTITENDNIDINTIVFNDEYKDATPVVETEDLKITKTISGDLNDEEKYGGITFVVSAGEGKYLGKDADGNAVISENVADGTYVIAAAPGSDANTFDKVDGEDGAYELTFAGVPAGTTVTVTETDSYVEGYTETVTYFVNGGAEATGSEASVTITKDDNFDTNTVIFNDEYTEDKGSLKITKLFGQDSDLIPADLTAAQKENISFTITGPDDFNTTIKLSEFGENNYYVLTDLALGLYTVVESQTDENTPNYTLETTYSVANGTIEVTKSLDPVEIVVTNTYTEDTPVIETEDLKITKTISGDLNDEEKYGGITFVVSAGEGKYLGKDADGNAVISENVADGTYVIAAAPGSDANTFDKVDGEDGAYELTFANVPVGTTVTVTETDSFVEGYTETVTYFVNGGAETTGNEASVTITKDDNFDTNTIIFNDEYTDSTPVIETEDLKITKTISGDLNDEEKYGGITFVVSAGEGKYLGKDADGNAVISENVADGTYVIAAAPGSDANTFDKVDGEDGAYELTFANVPVGTTVTVTETDSFVEGYTETVTYFVNGGAETTGNEASVTITKDDNFDTNTVIFNDEYTDSTPVIETEDLKITKTISGDLNDEEKYGGITFVVSAGEGKYLGKDADGNAVISENVADGTYVIAAAPGSDANTFDKVDGEDGAYELTFANVPVGTTVTVTETDSFVEGYTETVTYFVNGGAETAGNEASVTITKDDNFDTNTIIFNDEYTEDKAPSGTLVIEVTEKSSGKPVEEAKVKIEYPEESGLEDEIAVTDSEGKIVKPDVPSGTYKITVIEVPVGYDVEIGEEGTVDVPENGEGKHKAEIATEKGGLVITVFDEETGDVVPKAKLEIELPDGTKKTVTTDELGQVEEYSKTDEFGNYTSELGKYKITVIEVPDGYNVTVGKVTEGEVEKGKLTEVEVFIKPSPSPEEPSGTSETTSTSDTTSTSTSTSTSTTGSTTGETTSVKTGDSSYITFLALLAALSLMTSIVLWRRKEEA